MKSHNPSVTSVKEGKHTYMLETEKVYQTQIIGCGPAGIGTLVAADRNVWLPSMLIQGVALVESGGKKTFGQGGLHGLNLRSNSGSDDFHTAIREDGAYAGTLRGDNGRRLIKALGNNVSLGEVVAPFLGDLGHRTGSMVENCRASDVFLDTRVVRIEQHTGPKDADTQYTSVTANGDRITSKNVIVATGGIEKPAFVGNLADKLFLSHDVLTDEALQAIYDRLTQSDQQQLAFLGGSHSTFSALQRFLETIGTELSLDEGAITVVHRNPIRLFYPTISAARNDGYTFAPDDVCQKTGRVHRFGGLRADAKELYRKILSGEEKRVKLQQVEDLTDASAILLTSSAIVQGLGYKANRLPIVDEQGRDIGPALRPSGEVFVNDRAQLHDTGMQPIPHMYGIGLGYGMRTSEKLGGEASYKGGPDGVNFYQGSIGEIITGQIIAEA